MERIQSARLMHAATVMRLTRAKPRVIVLDFHYHMQTPVDQELIQAMRQATSQNIPIVIVDYSWSYVPEAEVHPEIAALPGVFRGDVTGSQSGDEWIDSNTRVFECHLASQAAGYPVHPSIELLVRSLLSLPTTIDIADHSFYFEMDPARTQVIASAHPGARTLRAPGTAGSAIVLEPTSVFQFMVSGDELELQGGAVGDQYAIGRMRRATQRDVEPKMIPLTTFDQLSDEELVSRFQGKVVLFGSVEDDLDLHPHGQGGYVHGCQLMLHSIAATIHPSFGRVEWGFGASALPGTIASGIAGIAAALLIRSGRIKAALMVVVGSVLLITMVAIACFATFNILQLSIAPLCACVIGLCFMLIEGYLIRRPRR